VILFGYIKKRTQIDKFIPEIESDILDYSRKDNKRKQKNDNK
jgi:hypothetical protein